MIRHRFLRQELCFAKRSCLRHPYDGGAQAQARGNAGQSAAVYRSLAPLAACDIYPPV